MIIPSADDKAKAINILIDFVADESQKEDHDDALALITTPSR